MIDRIREALDASIAVKQALVKDTACLQTIEDVSKTIVETYRNDGKVLLCGNGGSAADAQHIACELSGRFFKDRDPLFAEALHVNTSYLTAVANDYGYDEVFSRLVKAKGRRGDVLFCISTSGNSPNILGAAREARDQALTTVAMTGEAGGKLTGACDFVFRMPSSVTPRIQEAHILVGHIICELVEAELFPAP